MEKTELYTTFTQTGMRGGTIAYASPEQIRDLKQSDERSDIYALGKLLFHMLTGEEPFPDMDMTLVTDKYRFIVNKCTQRNPDQRFQTIAELMGSFSQISNESAFTRIKKADEQMAEIFLQPINEGTISKINEIFATNQADYDLYTDYFPKLSNEHLNIYINTYFADFKDALQIYDGHVSGGLSFSYCDVVANTYENILFLTDDLDVWKLLLTRLLVMGVGHNRWHVMGTFHSILCRINDVSKALTAKDVIEQNPSDILRWKNVYQDIDGQMLQLLVDSINNIDDNNNQRLDDIPW